MRLPIQLTRLALHLMNWLHERFRGGSLLDDASVKRVCEVLRISQENADAEDLSGLAPSVSVILTCAEKDLEVLEFVINGLRNIVRLDSFESIKVAVPSQLMQHISILQLQLDFPRVKFVDEASEVDFIAIRDTFEATYTGRGNWCAQQLLKYFMILNATTEFVFVLDADTLLLRRVPCLTKDNRYILMPTFEYQIKYYEVLLKLGVIDNLPKFSFVPHHMFYSRELMKEIYGKLGSPSPLQLAQLLVSVGDRNAHSPFSLDYELYAQYLMDCLPDKVVLSRWANLSISRNLYLRLHRTPGAMRIIKIFFNSLSLHTHRLMGQTNL